MYSKIYTSPRRTSLKKPKHISNTNIFLKIEPLNIHNTSTGSFCFPVIVSLCELYIGLWEQFDVIRWLICMFENSEDPNIWELRRSCSNETKSLPITKSCLTAPAGNRTQGPWFNVPVLWPLSYWDTLRTCQKFSYKYNDTCQQEISVIHQNVNKDLSSFEQLLRYHSTPLKDNLKLLIWDPEMRYWKTEKAFLFHFLSQFTI